MIIKRDQAGRNVFIIFLSLMFIQHFQQPM